MHSKQRPTPSVAKNGSRLSAVICSVLDGKVPCCFAPVGLRESRDPPGLTQNRCCLCTSGRSDRGVAQVSELYQREVLEWDVVQRGLYRSFTGIFRTPARDTVLSSWVHLIWPTPIRHIVVSSTFATCAHAYVLRTCANGYS